MSRHADRIAALLTLLVAALVVGTTIRFNSFIPWGTDSGAYLVAARGWADADLFVPAPLTLHLSWAANGNIESPLGHRPGPERGTFTSIYPLGYPLLLAAALKLGGPLAPHVVSPVLAGVLAWCAFVLGRHVSTPWAGAMAALLVAACPVTLVHTLIPMSDVPAAAFWAMSWVVGMRRGYGAGATAGLCTAMAVMIRPNLAPLALVIAASTTVSDHTAVAARLKRFLVYGACAGVGPLMVMWSQAMLYGGPLVSGYPIPLHILFQSARMPYNAVFYPRALARLHTWLPLAGFLVAPLLFARRATSEHERRARIVVATAVGIAAVNYALYLPYLTFSEWQTLRFMLPALLAIFVLFAATLDWLRRRVHARSAALAMLAPAAAVLVVWLPRTEVERAFAQARSHERLLMMGHYLREALPANAVILTYAHSGAAAFYTGRSLVRLDLIGSDQLDAIVDDLARRKYRPVFLFDMAVEHELIAQQFAGSRYVRLGWLPRAEFATTLSVLAADAGDREAFLSGERWVPDVVRSAGAARPHPAWWPLAPPEHERIVLPPLAESLAFKVALEAEYARGLGRPAVAGRIDSRASVMWIRRYVRYRVHGCGHQDAVDKVVRQASGAGPQPLCVPAGRVTFPPRDETVDFRRQLEARAPAPGRDALSFVDLEGDAVWVQEYLRVRLEGCGHHEAVDEVIGRLRGTGRNRCGRGER